MEVDDSTKKSKEDKKSEPDFSQVMSDPAFLQGVLQSLPGVDPESNVVRQAVGSVVGQQEKNKEKKDSKSDKSKDKKKEKESDN